MWGRIATFARVALLFALVVPLAAKVDTAGAGNEETAATQSAGVATGASAPIAPGEIPGLRTRTSRTFADERGTYRLEAHAESVNYADGNGGWLPIDNDLVAASDAAYAFRNTANRFTVELPSSLGGAPVRIRNGGEWISFKLEGASGAVGTASGTTARYADAVPGVVVAYTARGDSLKEELTLASPTAPSSFRFSVRASAAVVGAAKAGAGVEFTRSDGSTAFSFSPPSMVDAAGAFSAAVSLKLADTAEGWTLELSADRGWLAQPERKWPVVIDPTTFVGYERSMSPTPGPACTIVSAGSADAGCTGYPVAGSDGNAIRRTLIALDTDALPRAAQVLYARLQIRRAETTTGGSISLHRLTRSWTEGATWASSGTNAWTTPGGDYAATASDTNPNAGGWSGSYAAWFLTELVQSWHDGTHPNYGVLMKATSETAGTIRRFDWMTFTIYYKKRTGQLRQYALEGERLSDRSGLAVNVANGNVLAEATDLSIAGTGLGLTIDRYYNSLDLQACDPHCAARGRTGAFSYGWTMGTGPDVGLRLYTELAGSGADDGSAVFYGPSGYAVPFPRKRDGTFAAPKSGVDAKLEKNADGTYTLTFDASELEYHFNGSGFVTAQEDANGNRIACSYNTSNQLTSITDTQGRVTTLAYNGAGFVSLITDPSGRKVSYGYDASNRLTSYTDPIGGVTSYAYDDYHRLTQISDAKGNVTKISYAVRGAMPVGIDDISITRVSDPATGTGPKTRYEVCAYGQTGCPEAAPTNETLARTVVTDANGDMTTYYTDVAGRSYKVKNALGKSRSVTYTANSDVATATSATGAVTTHGYDALGNPTSSAIPTGATTRWQYADSAHPYHVTKATDAQGSSESYAYDVNGNLTSITNGLATENRQSFTYNANGTLASETDARGTTTSYLYDAKGNLTKIDNPAPLGDRSYTYDSLSRVATETDGKGQKTTYTYDALDRVTKVSYHDGSSVSYVYDAIGNATRLLDTTGTTSYEYDRLSQLTKETLPGGKTNSYGYDGVGNLASLTDAGGTVRYLYDDAGQLTTLTDRRGRQFTFVVDANGNRTEARYPNGITIYRSYDASERLTEVMAKKPASGTVVRRFTYSYTTSTGADRDLRQSVTDVAGEKTAYSYDVASRLTKAQTTGSAGTVLSTYTYAYDGNDNRTSETLNGVTTSYVYNAADALTQAGSTTYTWDANGNMTGSSAGDSFSYNAQDQTTSVTPAGGSATSMSYTGIAQGYRTDAGATGYVENQIGLGSETDAAGTTYYTQDISGEYLEEQLPNTTTHFPLPDGDGSVSAITDINGGVENSYEYDAFGDTTSEKEVIENPFEYGGEYEDENTRLYKTAEGYTQPALGIQTQLTDFATPDGCRIECFLFMGCRFTCSSEMSAKKRPKVCTLKCQVAGPKPKCGGRTGEYIRGVGVGSTQEQARKNAYEDAVRKLKARYGPASGCYLRHCIPTYSN